jgi:predicted enzyme related to lactoylglutathione lyase
MAAQTGEIGISGIVQIAVTVKDVARAMAFYRDTLGLKFLFDTGILAFFDCGGVRLMLSTAEQEELQHPSVIYYRVPDIHRATAALKAKGVKFEEEPHMIAKMPDHDLWLVAFRDSEENICALMSEVR